MSVLFQQSSVANQMKKLMSKGSMVLGNDDNKDKIKVSGTVEWKSIDPVSY